MRTVAFPAAAEPGEERLELLVPDGWRDSVSGSVLTLVQKSKGVGALQLSFASHLYSPGMVLPQLVELAENFASRDVIGVPFDSKGWRRIPDGAEEGPMDAKTGSRTPDDLIAGAASAHKRNDFIRYFFMAQRSSLVFASWVCSWRRKPGELEIAESILRSLEIRR